MGSPTISVLPVGSPPTPKPPPPAPPSLSRRARQILGDLPKTYDKRFRINLSILTSRKLRGGGVGPSDREEAALLYEDFLQKDRFMRIRKIFAAKAALPIAAHRSEILAALEHNPVVIIAGDTGCGKSTQVRTRG